MRQSARQVEQESQREAELAAEVVAAEVDRKLRSERMKALQEQLFSVIPAVVEDFELPAELNSIEKGGKVAFRTKKGLPFGVPHYRTLKRNLYKPPLERPQLSEGDDIPVCSCTVDLGCGILCQNRNLYMECVPGYCPSCAVTGEADDLVIDNGGSGRQRSLNSCVDSSDRTIGGNNKSETEDEDEDEDEDKDEEEDEGRLARHADMPVVTMGSLYCKNTAIQRKSFPRTEVIDPGNGCGFGLRVMEDVCAGTILIEYLGEVITQEETNDRMAQCDEHDDFYFASLGGGLYLDAKPMGSVARFANHSCDPSCELQKWNVRGEPRICLVSTKPMKNGEQITYNYQYHEDGFDTTGGGGADTAAFRRQKCLCGSENCCGTIGGRVEESASSIWRTRARRVLEPSGKAGPKMTFSDLLDLTSSHALLEAKISPDSTEVVALKELISQGISWLQKGVAIVPTDLYLFEELNHFSGAGAGAGAGAPDEGGDDGSPSASTPASFISLPDLQELIKVAPVAMRFLALPALKQAAKRASDAERSAKELVGMLDANTAITGARPFVSIDSGSGSGDNDGKSCSPGKAVSGQVHGQIQAPSDPRIYWEDLTATLREISCSLPVLVSPEMVWRILELYQECSNWCRRWLSGLRPLVETFDTGVKSVRADSGHEIERGDKLLWGSMTHISSAYDCAITCDYFLVHTFLQNRIIAAMARPSFRNAVSKAKSSGRGRLKSKEGKEGRTDKASGRSSINADKSEDLHCFCQLPEHEGELGILAMCEQCHRWYHPTCLNTNSARLSNYKFYCPLCCVNSGLHLSLNRLAVAPIAEYAIKPGQDRQVIVGRKPSNSGKGRGNSKCKDRNSDNAQGSNKRLRLHQPHGQYQRFLSGVAHLRPVGAKRCNEGLSLPKLGQSDYLSPISLSACLEEESRLRVCATGVQQLLEVMRTFVSSWSTDVDAFMADTALSYALCGTANMGAEASSNDDSGHYIDGKPNQKSAVSEVLDRCLQLYYAPRVVRMRPYESLATLRKIAWALSVQPLTKYMPSVSPTSTSTTTTTTNGSAMELVLRLERDMLAQYADPADYDKNWRPSSSSSSTSSALPQSSIPAATLSGRALVALMRREIRTATSSNTPSLALADLNSIVHGAAALGLPFEATHRKVGGAPSSENIAFEIECYSVTLACLHTACKQTLARAEAFLGQAIRTSATRAAPMSTPVNQAVNELCTHAMQLSQSVQLQEAGQGGGGPSPESAAGLMRNLANGIEPASKLTDSASTPYLLPQLPTKGRGKYPRLSFDSVQMAELCAICLRLRAIGQYIDLSGNYASCALLTFLVHVMRGHDDKVETWASGGADLGSGTDCDSTSGTEKEATASDGNMEVDDKGAETEDEYCWCLRGEGPHVGQMIACDVCEGWYHVDCVTKGLSQKAASNLSSFVCCACETARGRRYKHSWTA